MSIKIGDISQTYGFTLAIKDKISVASRNKLLLKLSCYNDGTTCA